VISATINEPNRFYDIIVVDTDTGKTVAGCWAMATKCNQEIAIPWSQNHEPKDLHLEAEVVFGGEPPSGIGSPLTIHVERFTWTISLSASKDPVTVGEETTLTVENLEPSPRYTGYLTKIFNDDTGALITACADSKCQGYLEFPYSTQAEAGVVNVHAEVVAESAPYDVAGRADLTLLVDPVPFQVGMTFSEPQTSGSGVPSWLATVSASPALGAGFFSIEIETPSGELVGGCAIWLVSCAQRLGPGTYRGTVRDSESIYAASQWWTISPSPSTEPDEDAADDFNLLALVALFAGPSEVCSALLFYPGTHLQSSSVSDQYLACEGAVTGGSSTIGTLRAVAAAGGGTAVLWYLYERQTETQTAPEQTEPSEEEAEPPPAPPIGWPGEVSTDAGTLGEQNTQITSTRQARVVIKQCHRLVIRAGLPTSRCTELPIFASGDLDVPQATKHDLEAILYHPPWVKLNYESSVGKSGRDWYLNLPVCEGNSELIHCDEFPFFSTEQGGGDAKPRPSLKLIDRTQNLRQGGKLGAFYSRCGVNIGAGRPFLNVPMPRGSNIPTLILCNGNS